MIGIAIERWSSKKEQEVIDWLREAYGYPSKITWFVDQDFDLRTLILDDKIYTMYLLKWS